MCHYCVLTSAVAIFCAAIFSYFNLIIFLRLIKTFLKILYLFFFLLFFVADVVQPTVLQSSHLFAYENFTENITFVSLVLALKKEKEKQRTLSHVTQAT